MNNYNPFLCTDGYKATHKQQYPKGTTLVYSNFTPRHGKHSNVNIGGVISFGQQMVMQQIKEMFDEHFFATAARKLSSGFGVQAQLGFKERVCQEIKQEYSTYLGYDYDVSHIEELWDLGYLPIKVKVIPEGTFVPYGVPVLTIVNTKPEFFWLTNFLETLISNMLWMPMTSATTAYGYRKILDKYAYETDRANIDFVDFQGHNFGMRGMGGLDATVYAGIGHATSFKGDDSLPTIPTARKYYDMKEGFIVGSVPATEHSVMCAGGDQDELGTFRHLMNKFPTGVLSIVSDTWDLWRVLTEYLPTLKDEIMSRDGKIVIRPDSGDPVDIICGDKVIEDFTDNKYVYELEDCAGMFSDQFRERLVEDAGYGECGDDTIEAYFKYEGNFYKCIGNAMWDRHDKEYYYISDLSFTIEEVELTVQNKGVIELLWEVFGGTINSQGYKVLDPHIGAIYGDSITLTRAEEICKRLEAKGFASTNIVLGIGSFTYQYVTRDTHGFAMKATYVEVFKEGEGIDRREIFKDPITGDGSKKSAKGLLHVSKLLDHGGEFLNYHLTDQVSWDMENKGFLQTIFEDGEFTNRVTLTQIRERLNGNNK